ncbi:MAG: ABC transporter substrate-binding protein [Actinomycetota bacterium]
MWSRLRGALVGALAVAATLASGCGAGATRFPAAESPPRAGGNGELVYAIPAPAGGLDPLAAHTISEQTVARQIFEPLTASLDGPYGRRRNVPGVALSSRHSGDFRVWSLRLRPGVRFQDGRLLDASAVVVNAERWRTSAVGRRLPSLIAADAPRPDLVRFVFDAPVRDLPARLGDPRLGLVSPAALLPQSGTDASLFRVRQAGSGPFQLSARPSGGVVLERNRGWWGSRRGLGPALDEVAFRAVGSRVGRLVLLRSAAVRVAGDVGRAAAQRLRTDPLLTSIAVASPYPIGLERSVRGIVGWRPVSLSGVWLSVVNRG